MIGKSPWLQSVHVAADIAIGEMVPVEIMAAGPHSVEGRIALKDAA